MNITNRLHPATKRIQKNREMIEQRETRSSFENLSDNEIIDLLVLALEQWDTATYHTGVALLAQRHEVTYEQAHDSIVSNAASRGVVI